MRLIVTDLGIDVLCAAEDTERLTAALVAAGAVLELPDTVTERGVYVAEGAI